MGCTYRLRGTIKCGTTPTADEIERLEEDLDIECAVSFYDGALQVHIDEHAICWSWTEVIQRCLTEFAAKFAAEPCMLVGAEDDEPIRFSVGPVGFDPVKVEAEWLDREIAGLRRQKKSLSRLNSTR